MRAVFLDMHGTVTVGVPKYERVDSVDKVELLPDSLEALKILSGLDYDVFFVTNQAGIAEGIISMKDFWDINKRVLELIEPSGIKIIKTYLCPHGEKSDCLCRKPKPKLLKDAAREYGEDLSASYMIGDRESDVMTGINAGTKTILVATGDVAKDSPSRADFIAPSLLQAVNYIKENDDR